MIDLPPLPDNLILLVEVGSTSHGTGLPEAEDRDELGIVIEAPRSVLGLARDFKTVMHRTQPEGTRSGPGDTDRTFYSLREFLRLAAAGNPSIMASLWSPVIEPTPLGDELRELAPAFVGRHVIPRYRGYMQGQTLRLLGLKSSGHGRRGGGGREELISEHGYDTKYAMHAARLGYQCLELLSNEELSIPIEDETGDWLRAVRAGKVPFEDWWEEVLHLDTLMEQMSHVATIPERPDVARIERWSIVAHLERWQATWN